jgi:hypothetical protein
VPSGDVSVEIVDGFEFIVGDQVELLGSDLVAPR